MANDLTLTIRDADAGTDYVYGGDRLLVDVESKNKRVRGLDIEVENMPMTVGPTTAGTPELVGVSDPLALPEKTYRAKLEDGSGTLILDGAIVTSDAVYDAPTKSWEIVLVNQAPKDFWSLLKTEYIPFPERRSDLSITKTDVQCYEKDNRSSTGETYIERTRTFYQPRSVLGFIFDELGITYEMPTRLWEYDISYDGVSRTRSSEDVRISLGNRNMRTLVEEITQMAGWRTLVRYQSFPSEALNVEFRPTGWPLPAAQQVLDNAEGQEGHAVTIEPQNDNWGLELDNGPDEASPNPISETYESGPIPSFGIPPVYGAVAPQVWDTPPRESQERRIIAETAQTDFRVPPIAVEQSESVQSDTEWVQHGPLRLEITDEGVSKFRDLLVFETRQDANDSNWYAVHSRRPGAQEYDGTKTIGHSSAWASAAYEGQTLRRSSMRELEGDFIDIGEQTVGDPEQLVEMRSAKWMGHESRRDVAKLLTTLTLRRPVSVGQKPAEGQIPESLPWEVINPTGIYRTLNRGNGDEDWILMRWDRTPIANAVELFYNVELKDTRTDNPSWTSIGEVFEQTYATASTFQYESAGSGGASYSDGDIQARVRPAKGTEVVGGKIVPVAGEWNQFPINSE